VGNLALQGQLEPGHGKVAWKEKFQRDVTTAVKKKKRKEKCPIRSCQLLSVGIWDLRRVDVSKWDRVLGAKNCMPKRSSR
jgi:hypothetical protein